MQRRHISLQTARSYITMARNFETLDEAQINLVVNALEAMCIRIEKAQQRKKLHRWRIFKRLAPGP